MLLDSIFNFLYKCTLSCKLVRSHIRNKALVWLYHTEQQEGAHSALALDLDWTTGLHHGLSEGVIHLRKVQSKACVCVCIHAANIFLAKKQIHDDWIGKE
jgi:hypothetical protein